MNHFDYRDGVLYAEDVPVPAIAAEGRHAILLLFDSDADASLQVFAKAFEGLDALVCYAMKANSNQAMLRTLAKLGAGADVVSEGELRRALAAGIRPIEDHVFRRRQDGARDGFCARKLAFIASTSSPNPSWSCSRRAPSRWQDRADFTAHQPGCRRQDTQEDLHRQGRKQVRHCLAARRSDVYKRAASLPGIKVDRHRHPYWQPDHRLAAV
jgi:diaminopimelate decarboxylase